MAFAKGALDLGKDFSLIEVDGVIYIARRIEVSFYQSVSDLRGQMILARPFGQEDLRRLIALENAQMHLVGRAAEGAKAVGEQKPRSEYSVAIPLTDWSGAAIGEVVVGSKGWVYGVSWDFIRFEFLVLVTWAVLLFLLLDRIVWRMITRRLSQFCESVGEMYRKGPLGRRLPVEG